MMEKQGENGFKCEWMQSLWSCFGFLWSRKCTQCLTHTNSLKDWIIFSQAVPIKWQEFEEFLQFIFTTAIRLSCFGAGAFSIDNYYRAQYTRCLGSKLHSTTVLMSHSGPHSAQTVTLTFTPPPTTSHQQYHTTITPHHHHTIPPNHSPNQN